MLDITAAAVYREDRILYLIVEHHDIHRIHHHQVKLDSHSKTHALVQHIAGCKAAEMNLLGSESDVLSLDRIRATLIRLEDTIIFCEQGMADLHPGMTSMLQADTADTRQPSLSEHSLHGIPNCTKLAQFQSSQVLATTARGSTGSCARLNQCMVSSCSA